MTEPVTVATLYNPHEQTKQQLIDSFVVRTKLFQRLFRAIKEQDPAHPAQHYLIEGQRGMGKTTLLLRLSYAVENDPELDWLVPLVFKEEAYYGITRLEKLWEAVAELLEAKLPAFAGLLKTLQDGYAEHRDYEEDCFRCLVSALENQNKHLVLFIDNLGELFRQFSEHEAQRLREVLLTCPRLRLVGASAVVLEAFFRYEHAFYEFFKKESLRGLNSEETRDLLKSLAQAQGHAEAIEIILQQQPGRVETLRVLTGGVLRTLVLLFEIFLDNRNGNAISDLERVLDRVTPLYKHRMEELTPEQREVVHAVALAWDAVAPAELARQLRQPEARVRDTLAALEKVYILQRAPTDTREDFYYLYERFFNIWYLMRLAPRGSRGKVLWLVRFLEAWYDREQLAQRARRQIEALRAGEYHPKAARYLAEAMAYTGFLDMETEHELLRSTQDFLRVKDESLLAGLPESDKVFYEEALALYKKNEYQQAAEIFLRIRNPNEAVHFRLGYCFDEIKDYAKAEQYYLRAVEKGHTGAMFNLALLYQNQHQDYAKAEQYYLRAVEKGNASAMWFLANLYKNEYKDYAKAEQYYLRAVEKGNASAMWFLANLYKNEYKDYAKAEQYYLMAVEKGDADAMNSLALLYKNQHQDYARAEQYYLMAVEKGDASAMWSLANLYKNEYKDTAKAEQYYLMAVEKGHAGAMWFLADLYQYEYKDAAKAEQYYLMAVEKGDASAMNNLAWLYFETKKSKKKALQAIRQCVEKLEPSEPYSMHTLACVETWNDNFAEAAEAAQGFIHDERYYDGNRSDEFARYLMLLLAKQQTALVETYFQDPEINLKERFKPLYYAFLTLTKNPGAAKQPPELAEPVREMLAEIGKMAVDYR